ncbi:MAG: prolyl oligopeptidase family serine peptidase, partial [Pirellulales bacterium]
KKSIKYWCQFKGQGHWVRAHAEKYHVDVDHIGAYGNSSGGQLALMTALTTKQDNLEGDGPHLDHSSQLQAVVCSGTVGDMQHSDHSDLAKRVYLALAGSGNSDLSEAQLQTTLKQASPVNYIRKEMPPVLMIHGATDQTVHIASTDDFVKKMQQNSANITYLRYQDAGHGVMFQKQKETIPATLEFFAKHLKR